MSIKKDGQVQTKPCSLCKGSGLVSKKSSKGNDVPTACPVCDGFGFVILEQVISKGVPQNKVGRMP